MTEVDKLTLRRHLRSLFVWNFIGKISRHNEIPAHIIRSIALIATFSSPLLSPCTLI